MSTDDEADEAHTAGSSQATARLRHTGYTATPAAAAAQAEVDAARQLLPPLQSASASNLPRFTRCKRAFNTLRASVSIVHWVGSLLLPDGAGQIEVSLTVHSAGWDVDAYLCSRAPPLSTSGQPAASTPAAAASSSPHHLAAAAAAAAAAGSRGPQAGAGAPPSSAEVNRGTDNAITFTSGPFTVKAKKDHWGMLCLTGWPMHELAGWYAPGAYDVVLQEQVRHPAQAVAGKFTLTFSKCW
jgi:hypothetical protein